MVSIRLTCYVDKNSKLLKKTYLLALMSLLFLFNLLTLFFLHLALILKINNNAD